MRFGAGAEDSRPLGWTSAGIERLICYALPPILCHAPLDHLLKFLDKQVLVVACLQQVPFEKTQPGH